MTSLSSSARWMTLRILRSEARAIRQRTHEGEGADNNCHVIDQMTPNIPSLERCDGITVSLQRGTNDAV